MRQQAIAATFLLLLTPPAIASASSAIVPDQYATIAAAIASGVDSVLVRDGIYPEGVTFNRDIVLQSLPTPLGPLGTFDLHPQVLYIHGSVTQAGTVMGFHVVGDVTLGTINGGTMTVQDCRIDSTLGIGGSGSSGVALIRNNTVRGGLGVVEWNSDVSMNTVLAGGISVTAYSISRIHDNTVIGPAPVGISCSREVDIDYNYVRECTVGINIPCTQYTEVIGNLVEDCSGTAYRALANGYPCSGSSVWQNVARRCGGRGFDLEGNGWDPQGNTADNTGQEGIVASGVSTYFLNNTVLHSGGTGISAGTALNLTGNRVLNAGADGLLVGRADNVSSNIVGRSRGRGIVVNSEASGYRVRHNTVYLNAGVGIDLSGADASAIDSVANNIADGNTVGLHWTGTASPRLSCNDWYGNVTAKVVGALPAATDTTLNPLFCDLTNDNVSLSAVSALVNLQGCGLVGALGVGCSYPASADGTLREASGGLRAFPQPGRGVIQFLWRPGAAPSELEIYDISGARRWSMQVPQGRGEMRWDGADEGGQQLPAGVYFVRLTSAGIRSVARVVLVR
jgi:hypothetical protein